MTQEEKLLREYFKFDDVNQSKIIGVLPLTLIDLLLEYKELLKILRNDKESTNNKN